jgi:hypothetical protein
MPEPMSEPVPSSRIRTLDPRIGGGTPAGGNRHGGPARAGPATGVVYRATATVPMLCAAMRRG